MDPNTLPPEILPTLHEHTWEPIPEESGRYQCKSCPVKGFRDMKRGGIRPYASQDHVNRAIVGSKKRDVPAFRRAFDPSKLREE